MYVHTFSSVGGLGIRLESLRMFVHTIVENLGLCVELSPDLLNFISDVFWLQVVLCAAGIVGSAIAAAVCLCGRKARTSCSVQLGILALYDFLFLLTCLVLASLALADAWGNPVTKMLLVVRTFTLWGVTYTTLDVCFERCLSVCRPFLAHSRFTVSFALKRAAVIFCLGVCFTIPYILDLVYGYSVGDGCVFGRQLTPFGLTYTLYVSLLLLYVLPFVVIIVVNVIFAVTVWRLHHRAIRPTHDASAGAGGSGSSTTTSEQQLSMLVLSLSGWYALCMLSPSLLFLVRLTQVELFIPDTDVRVAAVADAVVVLSCCSNFLFYFLLFRPFRQVLCAWLGQRASSYRTSSPFHTAHSQVYKGNSTSDSIHQQPVAALPSSCCSDSSSQRDSYGF